MHLKYNGSFYIVISAITILLATLAISLWNNIPFEILSRDPLAVADLDPYTGILSNFGAIFWSLSFGICFFTFFTLLQKLIKLEKELIMFSGLLSLLLLTDDLFMLHEAVIPYFLGINEIFIFILYTAFFAFYFFYFRRDHLKSNFTMLILAFFFFGISIVIDFFQDSILSNQRHFYEDGSKFMGIVFWTNYQFINCKRIVISKMKI